MSSSESALWKYYYNVTITSLNGLPLLTIMHSTSGTVSLRIPASTQKKTQDVALDLKTQLGLQAQLPGLPNRVERCKGLVCLCYPGWDR